MEKNEIKEISINDRDFPELLKKIPNPPSLLYIRGKLKKKEKCFAIVGCRRYTAYGKQIASDFASGLSDAGLTIVSGLAPGIDTFAHAAVVQKEKRTIAVLGTGLDRDSIYPSENVKLAEKILELGGALISEYPPGTHGSKMTFPARDRLISGLSLGVLVVEAKTKSGSLITAAEAKKQERKVFAIPGSIYALNSQGTNSLIKRGGRLVDNVNDILKELKISGRKQAGIFEGQNEEEKIILKILQEGELYIDKIIEKTNLPSHIVVSNLAILEGEGKISNLGGNIYAINNR